MTDSCIARENRSERDIKSLSGFTGEAQGDVACEN